MRMAVGATRMNLMRLRRRLALARRGHKLLKDKQEELMRQIIGTLETIRSLRQQLENRLNEVFRRFAVARAAFGREQFAAALSLPTRRLSLEAAARTVLNVQVPVFRKKTGGNLFCYGFADTSAVLDLALVELDELLEPLLTLAEREKTLELLAAEMERTRRRVNALEFILIPGIEETIKFIRLKLVEAERGDLTRLMRVKEMIRGEE